MEEIIKLLEADWMYNVLMLIGIIVTGIVAYATIKNINKTTAEQINNQNLQNYKPFLDPKILKILNDPDNNVKTFEIKGNRFFEAEISNGYKKVEAQNIYLNLELNNCGTGLADKIKLFDLDKEYSLFKDHINDEADISDDSYHIVIPNGEKDIIQLKFKAAISPKKLYGLLEKRTTDYVTMLITYKDINNNLYSVKLMIDLYYDKKPRIKYEMVGRYDHQTIVFNYKDDKSNLARYIKRNSN